MHLKSLSVALLVCAIFSVSGIDWQGFREAKTLEKEKRYDEAIAVYEKMSDKTQNEKDDQQYMLWAAETAIAKKDPATARRLAGRVRNPDRRIFVLINILLPGEVIENSKDSDFSKWPEDIRATAYAIRGNAYFQMKQYDKALKDFDSALTLPGASVIWKGFAARNLGHIYEQQKNFAKAAEAYIMALAISKSDYAWRCESLIALSRILIRDKKTEEACRIFEPVERLSRMRGYWAVQLNTAYAEALSAAGKKTDAIKALDGLLTFVSEKEKEQIKKQIDKWSEDIL